MDMISLSRNGLHLNQSIKKLPSILSCLFLLSAGFSPKYSNVALFLCSIALFINLAINKTNDTINRDWFLPTISFIIFILSQFPALRTMNWSAEGWRFILTMTLYLLSFLVGYQITKNNKLSYKKIIFMSGISLVMFGISVVFNMNQSKLGGFDMDQVASASYIAMFVPFFWIIGLESTQFSKGIRLTFLLLSLCLAMILIGLLSRGAVLSVITILALYALVSLRKHLKVAALSLFFVSLICTVIMTEPKYSNRYALHHVALSLYEFLGISHAEIDATDPSGVESGVERLRLWKGAVGMFMDYPWTGVGLGNFNHMYQIKYAPADAIRKDLPHPHNNILFFLSDSGALGLLGYLITIITVLWCLGSKHHLNNSPLIKATAAMMILYLIVLGTTDCTFIFGSPSRVLWFLVGMSCALLPEHSTKKVTTFNKQELAI